MTVLGQWKNQSLSQKAKYVIISVGRGVLSFNLHLFINTVTWEKTKSIKQALIMKNSKVTQIKTNSLLQRLCQEQMILLPKLYRQGYFKAKP